MPPKPVTMKRTPLLAATDRLANWMIAPLTKPSATGSPPANVNFDVALSAATLVKSVSLSDPATSAAAVPRSAASISSA